MDSFNIKWPTEIDMPLNEETKPILEKSRKDFIICIFLKLRNWYKLNYHDQRNREAVHSTVIEFQLCLLWSLVRSPVVDMLYIDLRPGQTCNSKDGGSDTFRWQLWEEIAWDKVKSRATVIDWCTGREWPVNCMTVFSAWWRSNMPFQRLSGRWNYYITRWRQEVSKFGDQTRWWQDAVEEVCTQQNGPPGLRLSSTGEWERDADGHRSEG